MLVAEDSYEQLDYDLNVDETVVKKRLTSGTIAAIVDGEEVEGAHAIPNEDLVDVFDSAQVSFVFKIGRELGLGLVGVIFRITFSLAVAVDILSNFCRKFFYPNSTFRFQANPC